MTTMVSGPTVLRPRGLTEADRTRAWAGPGRGQRTRDEELAMPQLLGDAALVSLLRAKPVEEAIPVSVWWLVAESLRTSVTLRRALVAPVLLPVDEVADLHAEAVLLTDAALIELQDATGEADVESSGSSVRIVQPRPEGTPGAALQRSALHLARLLVGHQATPPAHLAVALSAHRDALRSCEPVSPASA